MRLGRTLLASGPISVISTAYDGARQNAQEVHRGAKVSRQGPRLGIQRLSAVWDDGECYVIQGWRINVPGTLAQVGTVPAHETVLRPPKRMMQFFEEVGSDGAAGL